MSSDELVHNNGQSRLAILARMLFALIIILTTIWIGLGIALGLAGQPQAIVGEGAVLIGIWLTNGIVAFLILSHYPRHMVGWLLLTVSLSFALIGIAVRLENLSQHSLVNANNPVVAAVLWISRWTALPVVTIFFSLIPLYFPDGRLLSRRWRFVAISATIGIFTSMAALAVHPGPVEGGASSENPYDFGIDANLADSLLAIVATPALAIGIVGAFASVIMRFRRSTRVQRAQMKWVLYALGLILGAWSGLTLLGELLPKGLDLSDSYSVLGLLASVVIPIVIGIAILRHRLYDIDVIIRKTLVYGVVTAALAAVYFSSVVVLQQLFTNVSGQQSPVAIVISTLLIAALFSPLRGRVQEFIDRRFYRAKYDTAQTLNRFAQAARDETDLDALTGELVSVVQATMQPEKVGVWLRPDDRR